MVAIKDMEMPKDCMECMFCNHIKSNDYGTYGDCAILGDKERMNLLLHQKHSDCPLIDIEERNATNGDMIKAMFPNYEIKIGSGQVCLYYPVTEEYSGSWIRFDLEWWNALYTEKRGNENEIRN